MTLGHATHQTEQWLADLSRSAGPLEDDDDVAALRSTKPVQVGHFKRSRERRMI
jgi:hypothetical protein